MRKINAIIVGEYFNRLSDAAEFYLSPMITQYIPPNRFTVADWLILVVGWIILVAMSRIRA